MDTPEYVVVARVGKPKGVHGDVHVECLSDVADRLSTLRVVRAVARNGAARSLTVVGNERADINHTLHFDGIEDRDSAESLAGNFLEVPVSDAPPLPEGLYYHWQLVGLKVIGDDGTDLGTLTEVLQPGANDVYVVQGPSGEVLIPAVKECVKATDLSAGTMTVHLLPGLLPE